jgi:hypothetical protein
MQDGQFWGIMFYAKLAFSMMADVCWAVVSSSVLGSTWPSFLFWGALF